MSKKKAAEIEEPEAPVEDPEVPAADVGDPEAEDPAVVDAKRIADLEAENAALKARPIAQAAPIAQGQPKVTGAILRSMPPAQRKEVEEHFGRPFDEIIHEVEATELRMENSDVKARLNVADMIEEAQAADPKVHNLRIHMKAYLNRLPLEVRADPARLKEEIAHAKTYARGKLAESGGVSARAAVPGGKVKPNANPTPEGEDPEPELEEGEIKSGTDFVSKDGNFKFKVGIDDDRLTKEKRAKLKHPNDVNGVMFRNADKPPVFNRD